MTLKRRTPLRARTGLKRSGSLSAISDRRRRRDRAYPAARAQVYERAGGRCEFREHVWQITARCGADMVDVHHIAGRGGPDPHRLDNLAGLCRAHHRWVHDHPAEAYELGLMVSRHAVHDEGEVA